MTALLVACGDDAPSSTTNPSDDVALDVRDDADASAPDADIDADAAADLPVDSADDVPVDVELDTPDTADAEPDPVDDPLEDVEDATDADAPDADAGMCQELEPFDYSCDSDEPDTCPGGFCIFGGCIAPVVNTDRWDDCGDGTCGMCETADNCPADCGSPPVFSGAKEYDNDTTITVSVHGFNVVARSEFEETVYGEARRPRNLSAFKPDLIDGRDEPLAPNQVIGVEYYGSIPADYLTQADIDEIEAHPWDTEAGLHRYALIVGKFLRHTMATTGATHANLLCHSMGCHIIRYVIENDIEGLASDNVIVRWLSIAGVVAGARLARLFDNPTVREVAELLELNTADFIHMNPDYVIDNSAVWDHKPREANNPLFTGILIHHCVATDPKVSQTADLVRLLDLSNPDNEPNDGIVFSFDEYFHAQAEAVQFEAPDGTKLLPTRSYRFLDHFEQSDALASDLLAVASLFHRRKVLITLEEIELHEDLENGDLDDPGEPPAEITVTSRVRYNPYVLDTFGQDVLVHEQMIDDDRSPEVFLMLQGATIEPEMRIFEGPILDEMTELSLSFEVVETDNYPRFDVNEWLLDPHDTLVSFTGQVPLTDGTYEIESGDARVVYTVDVVDLY